MYFDFTSGELHLKKYRELIIILRSGENTLEQIMQKLGRQNTSYARCTTQMRLVFLCNEGVIERVGDVYRMKHS